MPSWPMSWGQFRGGESCLWNHIWPADCYRWEVERRTIFTDRVGSWWSVAGWTTIIWIPQRDVDFASKFWTSVMMILTDTDFSEDWITTYCNSNFWCLSCYSSGCKLCVVRKKSKSPQLSTSGDRRSTFHEVDGKQGRDQVTWSCLMEANRGEPSQGSTSFCWWQ